VSIPKQGDDDVVPVGEDGGFDIDDLADGSFDRESAAVDFGVDALDHGAERPRFGDARAQSVAARGGGLSSIRRRPAVD
jgi:hypothetical protein